ncbi:PAP2 superfamily protein [Pleurostoma richardsiae]|uniref:PAP2 superfamily protein n=1 Tax=Pleurostoma richardsiae TaxID=41990 RepID=A0AA38S387_9PEZI|nr:PAP2 superfamily protein [Pleurostoma richardsiae]
MDQDTPLQPASQDRVNIQREPGLLVSARDDGHDRDSSVHDKINQFNSLAVQSKQLERKTADAALKRAMLGREEAETEMRRFRDEARVLRKQVEEGKERERRVGERLETVMENYGRAKETHAHTQSLWEKEIRRARKETFKLQSVLVKLQEELKAARMAQKSAEEALESERLRSQAREQEAFSARYDLVGIQGQLQEALERTKVAEHERDAFKTLAKSEEDIARIAAEGKLPLPPSRDKGEEEEFEEEFASPTKKKARVSSVTAADIKTSAWSEAELDELTRLWQWEKQRAARALDHVRYLETEV